MNKILTQESYNDINATLYKLRDQILDVNDHNTRVALMEQRDVMKRMIDGYPFKTMSPTLPQPPAGVESYDPNPLQWVHDLVKVFKDRGI